MCNIHTYINNIYIFGTLHPSSPFFGPLGHTSSVPLSRLCLVFVLHGRGLPLSQGARAWFQPTNQPPLGTLRVCPGIIPYHPWDWYIYLHEWLIFMGKCREIYHTWIVWVMIPKSSVHCVHCTFVCSRCTIQCIGKKFSRGK